jgi:hypothetical protein
VLNNNTLQNIQLVNLANGNNNKLAYETDTDKPVNLSVPDPPEMESRRCRFSKSEGQENKFRNRKMLLRRPSGEWLPFNSELHKRKQTTAPRGGRNWKGITG